MPIVDGIENFVGNIKRYYRLGGAASDDPMRHHFTFHETHGGDGRVIDHGIVDESAFHRIVDAWEADSRKMFASLVRLTTGFVSYVLYEANS